jgi:type III pantothenate kinase
MSTILLLDIGNTHCHVGLGTETRVLRKIEIPTNTWLDGRAPILVERFLNKRSLIGAAVCSVVPSATPRVLRATRERFGIECFELNHRTVAGIGVDYPKPRTIGADRLANAVAVRHHHGCPAVVVDFGTAVTFDVVNRRGNYVGGIIAPGLSAMTTYLHEKTALLPEIRIREPRSVVGKNTVEAMLVGAVNGYRGLVKGLLAELKGHLRARRLPVVATGGYASLLAAKLPEITHVDQLLTLEGLRLVWMARRGKGSGLTGAK